MPTKKATNKSIKSKSTVPRSKPNHPEQVDDPIIVKGGGSLIVEMDKNFRDPYTPSKPNKKGDKHPDATRITYVLIKDKNDKVKVRIEITDKDDQVVICYQNPVNGCDCA